MLDLVEPDVHWVAKLLSLSNIMPKKTKETARVAVRGTVQQLQRKLEQTMREAPSARFLS